MLKHKFSHAEHADESTLTDANTRYDEIKNLLIQQKNIPESVGIWDGIIQDLKDTEDELALTMDGSHPIIMSKRASSLYYDR